MFCLDSQRLETRVPREVTRSKMAEDAESKIAVRLVNEYGYKESSTGTLFAKKKLKQIAITGLSQSSVPRLIPVNTN